MASNISPGVYTKIIDLSSYVSAVPSTIGTLCALTKKGRDNQLVFVGSRSELIGEWGEPNIDDYGKNYGQGPYCAYNFLGESGSLYFMRCMPDDATFSNIIISGVMTPIDSTATISLSYSDSLNTYADINTVLANYAHTYPLCVLFPIGRGEYYNEISVRLTQYSNPLLNDVFVLDIYEKQSDGVDTIIESFEVSFDPTSKDTSGDSMWIVYVLNNYSSVLRADMTLTSGEYSGGYDLLIKVFDKNIGDVLVDLSSGLISDNKQVFSDWENPTEAGNATFMVIAKDGFGNKIYGWLGAAEGTDFDACHVFDGRNLTTSIRGWCGDTASFNTNSDITYIIKKADTQISDAFASSTPVPLKKGSDGSLKNSDGSFNTSIGESCLANGYAGLLINPVTSQYEDSLLDTENIYFNMVFDCGYTDNVKTQISTLVQTRRDCVAILDNGDNSTFNLAISSRQNNHTFNNYFCALYEEYNKVYDVFTGQDIWFSPIYHMSYILPRNDTVSEQWFAAAGFNRAAIDSIKELRFNPKIGQRDQMYLKQLNPIVKFSQGYVVWGQLTSQTKASALQDLNIVRLVLYVKRALEQFCRYYIFEMNDAITWGQITSAIIPFLEDIKSRRGLYDYTLEVGATTYEIKKKTMHVNVTLNPTRVAEKIELNFYIV